MQIIRSLIVVVMFFMASDVYSGNSNYLYQQKLQSLIDISSRLNAGTFGYTSCFGNPPPKSYACQFRLYDVSSSVCGGGSDLWIDIEVYNCNGSYWSLVRSSCSNWYQIPSAYNVSFESDNYLITRHYTGQVLNDLTLNTYSQSYIDVSSLVIPQDEYPQKALLVNVWNCGGSENGYKALWADLCTGEMFYTGKGLCDDGDYSCFDNPNLAGCVTPTPTPTPTPVPSPTLPTSTPTPINTPVASPVPTLTPDVSGTPQPTPNPTSTPYHYPDPVYNSTVVPVPTSDGEMLETNIDDIEYDSSVPDVGQELTEDDTWLDNIFDMFSSHPVIDVIRNSKITTSGELCSLSVNLYGKTIEISFCELTDYVEMFGYFVMVCASIYAYFIIFKVS